MFKDHADVSMVREDGLKRFVRERQLTPELINQFDKEEQKYAELSRGDDPVRNMNFLKKCEDIVKAEIPDSVLWYPKVEQVKVAALRTEQAKPAQP
jgi:hypothetical protein